MHATETTLAQRRNTNILREDSTRLIVFFTFTANSIKLETGLRPNSAGRPYTLLLRIEALRFPTFGLLL